MQMWGLVSSIVLGIICANIHQKKGYSPVNGFLWGFFFSIIGLAVVLLEKNKDENQDKLSIGAWIAIFIGVAIALVIIINIIGMLL